MSEYKHKIGITQGDTNGIGWEVILKALSHPSMVELFIPVVYGAKHIADFYANKLEDVEPLQFNICRSAAEARKGKINLVECGDKSARIEVGRPTEEAAKQALEALEKAYGNSDMVPKGELRKRGKKATAQGVADVAESVRTPDVQLSMFQLEDPVLCQVRDEILHVDINNLTPVEALNKLNEIKKIITGKG